MAQSGNRPPRRGQSPKNGNRPLSDDRPGTDGGREESAAERARERLAKQNRPGQKRQGASQRARSEGPSAQRPKADASAARRARAGGSAPRRATAKNAPRRSTAMTVGVLGTVLVVLAVLVILVVSLTGKKAGGNGFGMKSAPATVVNAIGHVSPAAFAAAGYAPTASGPYTGSITALKAPQPSLTRGGKPLIAYMGSNWCPECAATRWPFVVALSRFGTFKGLRITVSSATDTPASVSTLSFYGSTYKSPYIAFLSDEMCSDVPSSSTSAAVLGCNGYKPLQPLSGTTKKIFNKYDFAPYETGQSEDAIPFIDFANKFIEDGALMDPTILTGLTQVQIAHSLGNPIASPAQTILVTANYYTAAICKLTNNKPGSVCQMPVVKQAGAGLKL